MESKVKKGEGRISAVRIDRRKRRRSSRRVEIDGGVVFREIERILRQFRPTVNIDGGGIIKILSNIS
jgi:hypothetical protein